MRQPRCWMPVAVCASSLTWLLVGPGSPHRSVAQSRGEIEIQVVVRDDNGKAVSQVSLQAEAWFPENIFSLNRPDIRASAVTDAKGQARIRVSSRIEKLRIWAEKKGHVTRLWEHPRVPQVVKIVLNRGTVIRGVVVDAEGKPVRDALVVCGDSSRLPRAKRACRTDAAGRFATPAQLEGKLRLTVVARGWMPTTQFVQVGKAMDKLRVSLNRGRKLHLRIVDGQGKPIAGAFVSIIEWRGTPLLTERLLVPRLGADELRMSTSIPTRADRNGEYRWDWAPDDELTVMVWSPDARKRLEVKVHATGKMQEIVMKGQTLVVTGKVVDKESGKPITDYTIVPLTATMIRGTATMSPVDRLKRSYDTPAFLYEYTFPPFDWNPNETVAFRFDAIGYRSYTTKRYPKKTARESLMVRLQQAPPGEGRVLSVSGTPAAGVPVWIVRPGTMMWVRSVNTYFDRQIAPTMISADGGKLRYPSIDTQHMAIAVTRNGYAEKYLDAAEPIGDLRLRRWARLEGRVVYDGRALKGVKVAASPLHDLHARSASVNPVVFDTFSGRTDGDGNFAIERVPAMRIALWYSIGSADTRDLYTSSIPLVLEPGTTHRLDLKKSRTVRLTGRIRLRGEAQDAPFPAGKIQLVRKEPASEPPSPSKSAPAVLTDLSGFTTRLWAGVRNQRSVMSITASVREDGTFRLPGVVPGQYRLLVTLYEPGRFGRDFPLGHYYLELDTSDYSLADGEVDLGELPVRAANIPRVGKVMPDLEYTDLSGVRHRLSEYRGNRVLLAFWGTHDSKTPRAVADLRNLRQARRRADDDLVFLCVRFGGNPDSTRRIAGPESDQWKVGLIEERRVREFARSIGTDSQPIYFLISPEGRLEAKDTFFRTIRTRIEGRS